MVFMVFTIITIIILAFNEQMSLSYCGNKEDKENCYHHDVQLSPSKGRTNGANYFRPNVQHDRNQKLKEDDIVSPTLLKTRKQLVELWLNPVANLNTSLDHIVESDQPHYECDCLKEHL